MKIDRDPHNINQQIWYYETPQGIEIVREVRDKNKVYLITDIFKVPFKKMEKSFIKWRKSKLK